MSDYTFETLNDKEFEVLTVDLLSKEFNTRIEWFKSGRDGGVDGRFFESCQFKEGLKKYSADNHTLTFLTLFKNSFTGSENVVIGLLPISRSFSFFK